MPTTLAELGALPRAELREHLRTGDVLEITTMVRDADDVALRRALALEHVRTEAVSALLARFDELADPERLAALTGTVRFELVRGPARGDTEVHTVVLAAGDVALRPGARPDVVVRADLLDFVRLVTGQADPALLYLADRLRLQGDELLALDVGSVFTVPGSGRAAVDPRSLDPVEVATAVAASSSEHVRRVMAGGFRPIVLEEVVRRLPDFLDADRAARLRLCVGFRVGGRPDGGHDRFTVHLADGACRVETDPPEGEHRDATLTLDGADFLRLVTGRLHPVRGVLSGAIKVKGDKTKALLLNGAMRPPQPRTQPRRGS